MTARSEHPVAIVTGGGRGIGAAIAAELGRRGAFVVTVDPLVTVDGSPVASDGGAEPTTAEQIVASGGRARASGISVTDADAVHGLVADLLAEHGRLDAVVNVAGITRPTGFATGTAEDWAAVLSVHLDGYLNMLAAALPPMAAAGSGRIVGVTSGSGWRAADAGAYSCAKRAVASLTWQLGRAAPPGVGVNAISPIAMTRMVTEAMARAKAASGPEKSGRATGGLSLGGMPAPEALGPLGAHLASVDGTSLRGQILFAGGSEAALVRSPRLLEAVRIPDPNDVFRVLDGVIDAWVLAEARQATTGGANPRFGALYRDEGASGATAEPVGLTERARRVLVVGDGDTAALIRRQLDARGVTAVADDSLEKAAVLGPIDAVVVEAREPGPQRGEPSWTEIVADHAGLADRIAADARWSRTIADHSAATGRPIRLIVLVDAATPAGRSRAQAAAQLSRAGAGSTDGRVTAVAVSVEDRGERAAAAALAALLALDDRATGLAGAELAVGAGWMGLRSHPTPAGSLVFGGPELPGWFDTAISEMAGTEGV